METHLKGTGIFLFENFKTNPTEVYYDETNYLQKYTTQYFNLKEPPSPSEQKPLFFKKKLKKAQPY